MQVIGGLTVAFRRHTHMLIAVVKPAYVLLNNLPFPLDTWACITDERPKPHDPAVGMATTTRLHPGDTAGIVLWQRLYRAGHAPSRGSTHAVFFRASGATFWSMPVTVGLVRRSFALPAAMGRNETAFHAALLTKHEHDDVTYLVVSRDLSPRLRLQNLCGVGLEVVEAGTSGEQVPAQRLPPGCEVVYEPPTLAKLYPLVYDEAVAKEGEKALVESAKNVSLKIRSSQLSGEGAEQEGTHGWSKPFWANGDHDMVLLVPGIGGLMVSTHLWGNTLEISILPTAGVSPTSCTSPLLRPTPSGSVGSVSIECTCDQLVISLDDEVASPSAIEEVIRLVYDKSALVYSKSDREGARLEFTVLSSRVDNKTEDSTGEFAVILIPRAEHAAQPQLVRVTPPPLLRFTIQYNAHAPSLVDELSLCVQSFTVQVEDTLLHRLRDLLATFQLPGTLANRLQELRSSQHHPPSLPGFLVVPVVVRGEAERDALPLCISRLSIEPVAFYLSARVSLKVLLSCRETPFHFSRYQLSGICSNWADVAQTISAHYFSSVVMKLGWLLGSIELIGNPGAFIQSVGRGFRDLVTLPYEGLTRSPDLFVMGLGRGTAAFVRHFSAGALGSVTNMASSLARNMERLSMDPNHVSYQDQRRRERPTTHFTSGLASGISSFGLSVVSAAAGIVDQPMQSFLQADESTSAIGATRSVLAGVGKGLIGAITKPVGGAMELLSQTGQGIMHGTGLACRLTHRTVELEMFTGPVLRTELPVTATKCAR